MAGAHSRHMQGDPRSVGGRPAFGAIAYRASRNAERGGDIAGLVPLLMAKDSLLPAARTGAGIAMRAVQSKASETAQGPYHALTTALETALGLPAVIYRSVAASVCPVPISCHLNLNRIRP